MGSEVQSVSRFPLEIEIPGKGVVTCELTRHTAPLTCSIILKNLPIQDRVHRMGSDFVYAESKLVIGPEKQRASFKRGEIGLMTSNGAVCVFLKDVSSGGSSYKMNLIGHVTQDLEVIESTRPGDTMLVRRKVG
jgi:hypothetical protein